MSIDASKVKDKVAKLFELEESYRDLSRQIEEAEKRNDSAKAEALRQRRLKLDSETQAFRYALSKAEEERYYSLSTPKKPELSTGTPREEIKKDERKTAPKAKASRSKNA